MHPDRRPTLQPFNPSYRGYDTTKIVLQESFPGPRLLGAFLCRASDSLMSLVEGRALPAHSIPSSWRATTCQPRIPATTGKKSFGRWLFFLN